MVAPSVRAGFPATAGLAGDPGPGNIAVPVCDIAVPDCVELVIREDIDNENVGVDDLTYRVSEPMTSCLLTIRFLQIWRRRRPAAK
jgi:hypothetical protein